MHRYEEIGQLTGVGIAGFAEVYKNDVYKMKCCVLKYMQSVVAMQQQLQADGTGTGTGTGPPLDITTGVGVIPLAPPKKYTLGHTDNGFPVLPRPMNTHGWTKQVWEHLHMEYMSCHYSECPVNIRAYTGIDMRG